MNDNTISRQVRRANERREAYDKETAECAKGTHPEYIDVTMDRIVFEAMHNMKNSIINWNNIIYGSDKRKMGQNTIDFSFTEVHSDLFRIILGIVYGERHGVIKSDNFNGMSFQHMS